LATCVGIFRLGLTSSYACLLLHRETNERYKLETRLSPSSHLNSCLVFSIRWKDCKTSSCTTSLGPLRPGSNMPLHLPPRIKKMRRIDRLSKQTLDPLNLGHSKIKPIDRQRGTPSPKPRRLLDRQPSPFDLVHMLGSNSIQPQETSPEAKPTSTHPRTPATLPAP
jgi:hypothetical protein